MSGRVIHKRSTSYEQYAAGVDEKELAQKLHERLALQHREVIAQLEAGIIPIPGKLESAAKKTEDENGLELHLLNPKTWFTSGFVVLEISLEEKLSRQKIADAEVQVFLEHEKHRTPCAETRTDTQGFAMLKFSMPADAADGSSLVVRATDNVLFGELRFRLKSKRREKTPATVA
jgi:hypothetical protein